MEDKVWNVTDPDAFWKEFFSQPYKGIIESLTVQFESQQRRLHYNDPPSGALEEVLNCIEPQLTRIYLYPNCFQFRDLSELPDLNKLYTILKDNGFDISLFFTYFDSGMDYLTLITYGSNKRLSQTETNYGRKSKLVISPNDKRPTIEEYLSSCSFLIELKSE